MTTTTQLQIPASTLHWLEKIPNDRPVAVLLRHSARGPLPPDDSGYHIPITPAGVTLATTLGQQLGKRLKTLHASPLLRCIQTAEALRAGSGVELTVHPDRLLGDPGVFVLDEKQAGQYWREQGHESMMLFLVNSDHALSGMADPATAAQTLVQQMLNVASDQIGLHIFVTHDALVAATALRLLKQTITCYDSPDYLEGAFFWCEGNTVHTAYREQETELSNTA